jgi:tetratricopeptide (TPR) repeat protein
MSSDIGTPYAGERLTEATLTCPACGRTAPPEAAFCASCGAGLTPHRVASPPVFAAIAAAITGRTAYDVLSRVGGIFEELGAVFEGVPEAPGTLVALFPPTEDAATLAARAALHARATAPEVRLGLDAAEVTERSDQDATWEFLIDRGVRLQAMAHDGEVVAGETLPALTEGAAVVEALDPAGGPVLLRSVRDRNPAGQPAARPAEPAAMAQQVAQAETISVPQPAAEPAEPTVVASPTRAALPATTELLDHLDEVRRRATSVAVVGAPGTGRSLLLRTFASRHEGPTVQIDARGGPAAPWPLAALVEAIAAGAAAGPDETGDDPRARLERILAGAEDRDRIVQRLTHVLGLDGGEPAADETRWAFRRLLGAAFAQPVLVVVDDVDHVAFGFTTFLTDVARAVRDLPVFVLVSAAAEPDGVDEVVHLEAVPAGEERPVETTTEPPRADLVDEVALLPEEATASPEALVRAAEHAAAAGDAAGAATLERRAAGQLSPEDPRRTGLCFSAAAHLADAGLRKDAESAITEGLALTGGSEEAVGWRLRVLRAELRTDDADEIDAARAIADEAYGRCRELGDDWGVARALALRATVRRARGHAAAVVEDLTEAAERAGAAGRPAERASALRGAAGALLDGPFAVEDAIARCEALLAGGELGRTTEQDLRGALAVLLARAGRGDEARPMVAGAVAALDDLDAQRDLAVALHRAAIVAWLSGDLVSAGAAFERAGTVAERAHEGPLVGCVAASRANLLPAPDPDAIAATGAADAALELAALAASRAAPADTATQVAWRTGRARALARLGRTAEADRVAREAVSLAEQTDSVDLRANALLYLAEVLEAADRPVEAASFGARATRLLTRKGAIATAAVPRRAPD